MGIITHYLVLKYLVLATVLLPILIIVIHVIGYYSSCSYGYYPLTKCR